MNNYIIYKLSFPNNKTYIGQTNINFNYKLSWYKSEVYNKNGKNYNRLIYKAIRKYGWDNVKQEIICTVSEEFVDDAERYFIKKYNSNNRNFGYNLEDGGCKNKHHSEETKKKMSIIKSGTNHPFYNKKRPEHSKRMSGENNPNYEQHRSKETIKKISNTLKNKYENEKHPNLGRKRIDLSERNKRCSKSVNMYVKSGEFIKTFESITQASKELNISKTRIWGVINNKYGCKSTGGYTFKYNYNIGV